jgi:hypothetical protein
MSSILEQLKGLTRPPVHAVEISGKKFFVRAMGPIARTVYVSLVMEAAASNSNVPPHLIVAAGICDSDGKLPDEEEKPAIIEELRTLDGGELTRASRKVLELSGLTKEALEKAEKN